MYMDKGIAASPGIEIGRVLVMKELHTDPERKTINPDEAEREISRLEQALAISEAQLQEIKKKVGQEIGTDKEEIFGAHLLILKDQVFLNDIKDKIFGSHLCAESAVNETVENYMGMFRDIDDKYLRERSADIKDIGYRIIKNLLGLADKFDTIHQEQAIVVAKDLTPSDTAQMDRTKIKAFITEIGGKTSHSAIIARSLGIPAVVGIANITKKVRDGDVLIVDGIDGTVFINPDAATLTCYCNKQAEYQKELKELSELRNLPGQTKCKERRVELAANIGSPKDCKGALESGAEGIGLFRTEFLYMDRQDLPCEEEQYEAYKAVAENMKPHPVIIRTLDIGGDKKLPYLEMPEELNPFLGWRAIRLCLDRQDIFKTQLRAILRASSYGLVRIMYPMISSLEEIRKANIVLHEAKEELENEGIPFDKNLQVGVMIEIPAAAIIADVLIKEVDFFSIGTNDLVQYTIAVDRMNENIAYLYEPLHPAVLRLIKHVIDASHRAGKWTGMCGEMAGDPTVAPLLLGLGLDEFSMSAPSISQVKRAIQHITYQQAKIIAEKALEQDDSQAVRHLLTNRNLRK